MHAKTNHTLTSVSNDISSPVHVSNDTSKPQSLQELQPQNQKTFEAEPSKLPIEILKFTEIKPKSLQKLQGLHIDEAL